MCSALRSALRELVINFDLCRLGTNAQNRKLAVTGQIHIELQHVESTAQKISVEVSQSESSVSSLQETLTRVHSKMGRGKNTRTGAREAGEEKSGAAEFFHSEAHKEESEYEFQIHGLRNFPFKVCAN